MINGDYTLKRAKKLAERLTKQEFASAEDLVAFATRLTWGRLPTDDEIAIDTFASAARREYRDAFDERFAGFEQFCQRYGIHVMPMSTTDDPVASLQTALGRRTH